MGALADYFGGLNRGAVAGTAGAPVDMATLGLNALIAGGGYAGHKLGLISSPPDLIDKPVGGSDWIAEKIRAMGILKDNPGSTGDAWGSATGNLLPTLAAAKAPQIARGLLQAGENLAAPTQLSKQAGAVVWHGSPHTFDAFDSSKIGTGEGAQAYGHGLYLADQKAVGQQYANDLAGNNLSPAGQQAYAVLQSNTHPVVKQRALANLPKSAIDEANGVTGGNLYKVDLPDEHIARMLDWDKPISQQHPDVQAALSVNGVNVPSDIQSISAAKEKADKLQSLLVNNKRLASWYDDFSGPRPFRAMDARISKAQSDYLEANRKGGELYNQIGGNGGASDILQKAGIPGVRYLDGGSRGTGEGTSNYVVFPGNESMLNIMERNGQPLPKSIAGVDAPDLTPPTP